MNAIYTMGYQMMTLGRYVEIMEEKGVDLLVDVRTKPFSRQAEFNRHHMVRRLKERYVWKGDILGGLSGPCSEEGILYLLKIAETTTPIVMCMEKAPSKCHRCYDIGKRLLDAGVDAIHLIDLPDKLVEYTTSEMLGPLT